MIVGPSMHASGGCAVVIRTLATSQLAERFDLVLVATHRDAGRLGKTARGVAGMACAAWLLARRRVDLVYLHASSGFSLRRKAVVAAIARVARRPYVVHVHGSNFDDYYRDAARWEQWVVRTTLKNAALVIALSPIWERRILALAPCRTVAIPNSVTIPPHPAPLDGSPPRIVCLGRLGDRKGSRTLVRALAILARSHGDARLVLAGDGDTTTVREEARRLGVSDRVEMPGWIDSGERARTLLEARVFALPSQAEGVPVALLEAMAYGIPSVVSPVGGIPDVFVPGHHGRFVPPDDPEALADELRALLDAPGAARKMGEQARRDATSMYATDVVAAQVGDALDQALGARA
jgi:glycosyltransferase involved in cell wall biosynthesis